MPRKCILELIFKNVHFFQKTSGEGWVRVPLKLDIIYGDTFGEITVFYYNLVGISMKSLRIIPDFSKESSYFQKSLYTDPRN